MITNDIQNKINKVASFYIFTYGIRGWNMDEFSAEAGITKRTLYKYVESKEKLVENFLINYIISVQNELSNQLTNVTDFQSGINHIVSIYPNLIIKMQSRIINDIFTQYPNIEQTVIKERENLTSDITAFIEKSKAEGVIEKKYSSQMILEIIQSQIIFYIKNYPDQFKEKITESISMLINGIIKRQA